MKVITKKRLINWPNLVVSVDSTQTYNIAAEPVDIVEKQLSENWSQYLNGTLKPKPVNNYFRQAEDPKNYLLINAGVQIRDAKERTGNGYSVRDFLIERTSPTYLNHSKNSATRNRVLQEAKAKLATHIRNNNLSLITETGEAKETAGMILSGVDRAIKFAKLFRLRNQNRARDLRRLIAGDRHTGRAMSRGALVRSATLNARDLYLEWTYGWKPLMGSLEQAIKLYDSYTNPHDLRIKMSGHSSAVWTEEQRLLNVKLSPFSAMGTLDVSITDVFKYDVWIGGVLINPEESDGLRSRLGLNFGDIIPSLWDLASLSFVSDYFVNIGDVLGNLSFSGSKLNPTSLYLTTKESRESTMVVSGLKRPSTAYVPASYKYTRVFFDTKGSNPVSKAVRFKRIPTTVGDLNVNLTLLDPSWDQIRKTILIATTRVKAFR